MSPANKAAYLLSARAESFQVQDTPYTSAGEGQLVIKNVAIGINPVEWKIQDHALLPVNYPVILGCDVAGEVVEVGPGVSCFKVGDRVTAQAEGVLVGDNTMSGFQTYTIIDERLAIPIPNAMAYERAVVLPLAFAVAAHALFHEGAIELPYPSLSPKPVDEVVLVWGGSTNIGGNAIQLAKASGYEVIAFCSPNNFDHVKKLGASQAFNYKSETLVADAVAAMKGKKLAGSLDCITDGVTTDILIQIVGQCEGRRFIAVDEPGVPTELPELGIRTKRIMGMVKGSPGILKEIYRGYLPAALEKGVFVPATETVVFKGGLESIQEAVNASKTASAQRNVVLL